MNWVESRLKCSLQNAWINLRETLIADIASWRELTKSSEDEPSVEEKNGRLIVSAKHKDEAPSVPWISVHCTATHISMRRGDRIDGNVTTVQFVPVLNQDGECRLRRDGEELQFWQVSREMLEPILFLPSTPD